MSRCPERLVPATLDRLLMTAVTEACQSLGVAQDDKTEVRQPISTHRGQVTSRPLIVTSARFPSSETFLSVFSHSCYCAAGGAARCDEEALRRPATGTEPSAAARR